METPPPIADAPKTDSDGEQKGQKSEEGRKKGGVAAMTRHLALGTALAALLFFTPLMTGAVEGQAWRWRLVKRKRASRREGVGHAEPGEVRRVAHQRRSER